MEMSDFTWQHQKGARPEIYVVTYVHNYILPFSNILFFISLFLHSFLGKYLNYFHLEN